jgi:hypothetical protein
VERRPVARVLGSIVLAIVLAGCSHSLELLGRQPAPEAPAAVLLGSFDERLAEALVGTLEELFRAHQCTPASA